MDVLVDPGGSAIMDPGEIRPYREGLLGTSGRTSVGDVFNSRLQESSERIPRETSGPRGPCPPLPLWTGSLGVDGCGQLGRPERAWTTGPPRGIRIRLGGCEVML